MGYYSDQILKSKNDAPVKRIYFNVSTFIISIEHTLLLLSTFGKYPLDPQLYTHNYNIRLTYQLLLSDAFEILRRSVDIYATTFEHSSSRFHLTCMFQSHLKWCWYIVIHLPLYAYISKDIVYTWITKRYQTFTNINCFKRTIYSPTSMIIVCHTSYVIPRVNHCGCSLHILRQHIMYMYITYGWCALQSNTNVPCKLI